MVQQHPAWSMDPRVILLYYESKLVQNYDYDFYTQNWTPPFTLKHPCGLHTLKHSSIYNGQTLGEPKMNKVGD